MASQPADSSLGLKTAVNTTDAIKYGFYLVAYFLVVGIVGFVLLLIGSAIVGAGSPSLGSSGSTGMVVIGGLVALAGISIFYAGFLGISYKLIADGVRAGMED